MGTQLTRWMLLLQTKENLLYFPGNRFSVMVHHTYSGLSRQYTHSRDRALW